MNDAAVFLWESCKPTLANSQSYAPCNRFKRDQHMHTGCMAFKITNDNVFSVKCIYFWSLGEFWCKCILSLKRPCPMIYRVFISTVNAWPGYLVYFEKIEFWIAVHYSLPRSQLFYRAIYHFLGNRILSCQSNHISSFLFKFCFFFASFHFLAPICSTGWGISAECKRILMRCSNQNKSLRWFHPTSILTTVVVMICFNSTEC